MYTVVQFVENQKFKVMAVPSGWVKKNYLFWPKLSNVKIEALRVSGDAYDGPTKKIPMIIFKRFKNLLLAEEAAEDLSKREVSDVDNKRKRLKGMKKPKLASQKDYNLMIKDCGNMTQKVFFEANNSKPEKPKLLSHGGDPVENHNPQLVNYNQSNEETMSYEQMKVDLKKFMESAVEEVVERCFQTNFARFAALLEIQRKDDSIEPQPVDAVEKHARISTEDELADWNIKLNSKELCRKYLEYFSKIIIPSAYKEKGDNACYTLVDCLFTRDFWTKMTWTGISRGNKAKRGFREYGNVTQLLCSIVQIGDPSYTARKLEMFCRNRLFRYCKSRSTNRQLRRSACRKRRGYKSPKETEKTRDEDKRTGNSNESIFAESMENDSEFNSDDDSEDAGMESTDDENEFECSAEDE
ncbi:uncharacterized protein LOC128746438 [Sabethes cyaneus]|uniref:uncharacterized protein LOC128746438 n=1 Tax=Sabethes cyaneus TaxID=53552 RepID=UPI00237E63CD|nr:uncharacterized protein LOC128746438 [Sabethes cyaneus]